MRRFEPDLRSMIIAFVVVAAALTMWSMAGKEMRERPWMHRNIGHAD